MVELTKGFMKALTMAILVTIVVGAAFLTGFGTGGMVAPILPGSAIVVSAKYPLPPAPDAPPVGLEEKFELFWETWGVLERIFYGEIPDAEQVTYGAINGVIRTLGDEHTVFIDPQHAAILKSDTSGSFEGIGTTVRMDSNGFLIVIHPFEGQPAAKAGLKPGDIILQVDDTPITNMNILEAISLIRGPVDSTVRLLVQREGEPEPFEVSVVRQKIDIPIIEAKIVEDTEIAYIRLTDFNIQATDKLKEALKETLKEKPKGLVFDLRNNRGGYLHIAVEVASQFIDEGTILVERDKEGEETKFDAQPGGLALDIPMVVLVNGGTASASEIVAGAIRDKGRAILIGQETFGKGSVQLPHTLSDGSELRITIAHWFTPNGTELQGQGLIPDIEVELTEQDFEANRDPQLERAVEYLKAQEEEEEGGEESSIWAPLYLPS